MEFPSEADLISVFEVLPIRKNEKDEFEFNTSTFIFENIDESIEVTLSPFYNEFSLTVVGKERQEPITRLKLRSIEKMEIVRDHTDEAIIRIFYGESDSYIHKLELVFQPYFRMELQEEYL